MNKDFETVREPEELEADRPDPEEPATWQRAEARPDAEIDDLDWADQHSIVGDPTLEDDVPESEVDPR